MSIDSSRLDALRKKLSLHLFGDSRLQAFAVLDGASNPGLLDRLYDDQPEFICLYRGALEPDIAECAPYLVKLENGSPFAEWLINGYLGRHWGIFSMVDADCELSVLCRHLRKMNMVYDENNKSVWFRYYDPRVLNVFLPSCNSEQLEVFFGPIQAFLAETEGGLDLTRFGWLERSLVIETV